MSSSIFTIYRKYKLMSVPVKAAFWFTICSFLQKGVAFITVPLFTRMMSTNDYGTYSLYVSWIQIFTVITTLYIYNGVADNAMSKFEDDRDRYISSMQGLTLTITLFVYTICFFNWDWLCKVLGLPSLAIKYMFIELLFLSSIYYWSCKQRFEYKYKSLVYVTILRTILVPLIGIIAVWYSSDKAIARIISTCAIECFICGYIFIYNFYKGKSFYNKSYWQYSMYLALPILPHYLSTVILSHGDRVMISKFCDNNSLALYSIAYSIGMISQVFVGSLNSATTPWIYKMLKTGNIKEIVNKSTPLLILIFTINLLLMLISPEIVLLFGSTSYANAVFVVPPVASSCFFIYLYGFLSFPEFYYEKTSFLMISSVFSAIINIILNYIFIPIFGFVAAAYTTMICYALYGLFHFLVGKVILLNYTGYKSILNNGLALALSTCIIFISLLIKYIFPYYYVRYTIILLLFYILYKRRDSINKLLKDK